MTDCQQRFRELVHPQEIILGEDLASLEKMPESSRIDRYNTLKEHEEEFMWEFTQDCPDFVTTEEREQVRSKFRLARLLLAASFYDEGNLPRALEDDFIETELQAVVDFERYKRFDALSEEQIEEKIRRMEGEVYELVTEYTSTQIRNMDELMDDPDVQQDVMERLLDRYEDRREKIRQGFFVYVETHGLEHMVESIEEAVQAVSDASQEREEIKEELKREIQELSSSLERDIQHQQRQVEAKLQSVEHEVTQKTVSRNELQAELEEVSQTRGELEEAQVEAIEQLTEQIEHTNSLESRLDQKIKELEEVKQKAAAKARKSAREETEEVIDDELETLQEQKEELELEVEQMEMERERIESSHNQLEERQQEIESRVSDIAESAVSSDGNLAEENVVTASMARLLEIDYIGRVDTSVHEVRTITTPDREFSVPEGYWADRSERRNERGRLEQLLVDGGDLEQYPMNRHARYEITTSSLLSLSEDREMVIEAVVASNLQAYAMNGFDATPGDLDTLLSVINGAVREAEEGDYHYLLGIGSPTGWSEAVHTQLETDQLSRSQYGRNLSLCLVDLQDGSVIHNPADEIASANRHLFEMPIEAERVEECVSLIRAEYIEDVTRESVMLQELVDDHGFETHVVKQAFDQLESEGAAEQLHVDEYGLGLDF
jgi:hypothetical protein